VGKSGSRRSRKQEKENRGRINTKKRALDKGPKLKHIAEAILNHTAYWNGGGGRNYHNFKGVREGLRTTD